LYPSLQSLQTGKSKSLSAYWELTKPRIVLLLDFTALMAFLVAASTINIVRLVAVIVAGTLASGGVGALNCYLDRDLDRTMGRTSRRPIPQGEVSPVHALVFGLALFGAGIVVSAMLQIGLPLSSYFVTTGIHGAHVLAGIFLIIYLVRRAATGGFSAERYGTVENFNLYWSFVNCVWLVVFPLFYLL